MSITLVHVIDIEDVEIEAGVNKYRARCDCDWVGDWTEEYWLADDAGWYHVDYPEGE